MTQIRVGDHVRHAHRPDVNGVVTHLTHDRWGNPRAMVAGHPGMFNRADLEVVKVTPTARFKAGDRVRRVAMFGSAFEGHRDATYEVTEYDPYTDDVWITPDPIDDGGPWSGINFELVTDEPSPRYVTATHADGTHGVLDTGTGTFAGFGPHSTVQDNQRTADELNAGSYRGQWLWRPYEAPGGVAVTDEPDLGETVLAVDDGWWDLELDGAGDVHVYAEDVRRFGLEVRVQARRKPATS